MKFKKTLLVLLSLFIFVLSAQDTNALTCTNLTSDFGISTRSSDVLALQNFLVSSDYLSATPNGYFGQGTLAALKKFQSVNGISSTGYVGPMTRALIQKISCTAQITPVQPPTVSVVNPPVVAVQPKVNFIFPNSGSVITLGQTSIIKWGGNLDLNYGLVLENEFGVTQGFVTTYPNQTSYSWDVGNVSVSNNDSLVTVEPGNYRIRFQSKANGATQGDVKSELFQIKAPEISVKSFMPTTISADNKSVGVIYGSGFFGKVSVRINDYNNQPASVLFTSKDGTVIVFSIPTTVSPGTYSLSVINKYSSIAGTGVVNVTNP